MKKVSKFNAALALGSLTAAVALLVGAPAAMAQTATGPSSVSGETAPGGGSFPGSFLVPGTNTSIKIGGFAKGVYIYDMDAPPGTPGAADVTAMGAVPLNGSSAHSMHGSSRLHARQSNLNVDARTPTAWGQLETFVLFDFFGQNTADNQAGNNTQNARLVLAYGTLGPLMVGQNISLWADGDALPETVDPTASVSAMNGLTNRNPQIRYTYAAGNGITAALSIENPEASGYNAATGAAYTATGSGGIDRTPDFVARVRADQAWGHVALTGLAHDMSVRSPGLARISKEGWGVELSGHLNTFGKDSAKLVAMYGTGLGRYMADMGSTVAGLQFNGTTGAAELAKSYGVNVAYTHWWTTELRSSVEAGYTHNSIDTGIITTAADQNAIDKRHILALGNLVWSPVPQVDLGIEYEWGQRTTWASTATTGDKGNLSRIETEAVFKF